MQRLLDQPIHHRRNAQRAHPALRLRDVHAAHRPRLIPPRQQLARIRSASVVSDESLSSATVEPIHARRTLVLNHPLIRELQVAAFHHLSISPLSLPPLSSARSRHVRLGAPQRSTGFRPALPRLGLLLPDQLLPSSASLRSRRLLAALHRSALRSSRRLLWPRLTSGDAIPTPFDVGSTRHTARSPRVLRTHLHAYACRIYAAAFRASIGLCTIFACSPRCVASIRFLFVRPALCLRLPPDSQSPATPLPFG